MSFVNVRENAAGVNLSARSRPSPNRAWPRAWLQWWSARRAARRQRAELYALSDRTLRDIGIDRSEIGSIAAYGGRDASRHPRGAA